MVGRTRRRLREKISPLTPTPFPAILLSMAGSPRLRIALAVAALLGAAGGATVVAQAANAAGDPAAAGATEGKAKGKARPKWNAPTKGKRGKTPAGAASGESATGESTAADGSKPGTDRADKTGSGEKAGVAAVGTASDAGASGGVNVVGVEEKGDAGMKVYKFGPVEVEGRLKSPQIVYFLRRVRAEFAAGELGHRSFLPELRDTRRNPALK